MDKKKERKQRIWKAGLLLCLLALAGILLYMVQSDSFSFALGSKEKQHLRIGIVNQDEGGQLNGTRYQLGEEFARLLTGKKDKEASWKVMSRDQAESRYQDDSLEAVIYVPKDFSRSVLQLNSFNPEKAKISYKVKKSVKKEESLEMSQQVGEYVHALNQEMIRLYFTSVINNLDDAKNQMRTIVGDETDIYNALSTFIYQPASQGIQSLDSLASLADSMKTSQQAFEQSTASFKDSTAGLLRQNAGTLFDQSGSILQEEQNLSRIIQHNAQTANDALKKQYAKDKDAYLSLFNNFSASLYLFGHPQKEDDKNETKSQLQLLSQSVADYNEKIKHYQKRLEETQKELEAISSSVAASREQVGQNYFNGQQIDTSSLGEDEGAILKAVDEGVDLGSARQALAQQVIHTLSNTDQLPADYTSQINRTLASISVDAGDYAALFSKLQAMGALTDQQVSDYTAKLHLLAQYASVKGVTTGSLPAYSVLSAENDKLPAAESKTITLEHVYPEMTSEGEGGGHYTATPIRVANVSSQGAENAAVSPSTDSISEPSTVQFQLQFSPVYGVNTIDFEIVIGREKIPQQYTFFYDGSKESNALIKADLPAIFAQLSRIDTAATSVKNLYGSPDASYDVNVADPSSDSVARMYGNLLPASVADKLHQEDVEQYRQTGIELYVKLSKEVNQLRKTAASLPQLQEKDLPANYFAKNLTDLTDWYQKASEELNNQYQQWKDKEPELLEVSPDDSADQLDGHRLYTTAGTSNRLYQIITGLASNTQTVSDTVTGNGNAVGSMDTQFSNLSDQAKRVQGDVSKVHQETASLIKDQAKNIEDTNTFNHRFQGVLANARSNGTDNQAVLDFLSNPIQAEKTKQSSFFSTAPIWVYLLLILLLTNTATAIAVRLSGRKKQELPEADEDCFE
ncbi:type VII secretion protein EsaA [Streptococcus sp. DD11]|uniref:type VII secretion protein EsaA n=1 Tax=Streptococcus sp. DD11 TaxID=1777879 RepID=UPI000AC6FCCE|nr:type VII secretion protein EsaA [Streptococcus sp. DD11]